MSGLVGNSLICIEVFLVRPNIHFVSRSGFIKTIYTVPCNQLFLLPVHLQHRPFMMTSSSSSDSLKILSVQIVNFTVVQIMSSLFPCYVTAPRSLL